MPEPGRLSSSFWNVTSTVGLPASANPLSTFDKELDRVLDDALRDVREIESALRRLQSQYKQMSAGAQSPVQQLNRNSAMLSLTVLLDIVRVFASHAKGTIFAGDIANRFSGVPVIDSMLRQLKVDLDAAKARLDARQSNGKSHLETSVRGGPVQQLSSSQSAATSTTKLKKP